MDFNENLIGGAWTEIGPVADQSELDQNLCYAELVREEGCHMPFGGHKVSSDCPLEQGRSAREIEMVKLFKIECAGAAMKLAALVAEGGEAIEGPFDGEEGITLLADLDAGASGNMCSALIPDLIKPIVAAHLAGDRETAEL